MAVSCYQFQSQNPFKTSHQVCLNSGPEKSSSSETDPAVEKKREIIKSEFETEKLLPDTVKKLNEALDKATEEELDVWLDNINQAMDELVLTDALLQRPEVAQNAPMQRALGAVFQERNRILGQLHLTTDDLRALGNLRTMTEDRVALLEAHLIQDPAKISEIKSHVLSFVRKAGSETPLGSHESVVAGTPYLFDFTNPIYEKINKFAQSKITLADAMKALGVNSLKLKKKNSRETVTAYLWPDRGPYGEAHSVPNDGTSVASPSTYLPVLEGDSFIMEKAEAPKQPITPDLTTTTTVSTASLGFDGMPKPVDGPDTGIPRGASSYRGSTWEDQMNEKGAPNTDLTASGAEAPSVDYSRLLGSKITLPKGVRQIFAKENPWEEIRNLKYKENGGERVYNAINFLAERLSKAGIPTDNRSMWQSIFGFELGIGGTHNTVSFNEIVRAAYNIQLGDKDKRFNKPGEWLLNAYQAATGAQKAEYGEVLKAAKIILDTLPNLKDSRVNAETYDAMSETGLPPEMQAASKYTDQYLFDRESLSAPVKLPVFQRFVLFLRGDKVPRITEENWLDQPGKASREARKLNQGEIEIVSQGEAYQTLMETGSPEAYVAALNRYRVLGETQINAMASMAGLNGIKLDEEETHTTPITLADVNSNTPPNADQEKAIHYGMMLEAAEKLRIYQDAESQLTAEERDKLNYNSTGDVYGTGSLGASMNTTEELQPGGEAALAARANILPGTSVDAGVVGSVWDNGDNAAGDLDARAGLSWKSRRFGRNHKMRAGAGVHGNVDLLTGDLGADANAYVMRDLNPNGLELRGGVNANISANNGAGVGAEIALEQDFDRVYQARLAEFKRENAADIDHAKQNARNAIDASDYDPAAKAALKLASDRHIDMLVEQGVSANWTKNQLKVAAGGFHADLGPGFLKNGVRMGPFITFAYGFKPTTYYLEPMSSSNGHADGSIDPDEWIPEDTETVKVDIPVNELYIGGDAERTNAVDRAKTKINAAREKRNAVLNDTMSFSRPNPEIPYDKVDFKNLSGRVNLYIDPSSDIEMVTDGSNNYLNAALANNFHVFIDTIDSTQGGGNTYAIYLSDKADATPESIKAASGETHLSWFQTLDGKINDSQIVGPNTHRFYTLSAARLGNLVSRDKDAEDYVTERTRENLARQTTARDATLFDEYSQEDFRLAETVGTQLINSGVDYDSLALGHHDAEINAKITELYVNNGLDASKVNIDRIFMARQKAMEIGRPNNLTVPIEWNSDAVSHINASGGALFTEYITRNKEAIEQGGLRGGLPTGSEFYISVSHNGVARGEALLLGYYDKRLHGDILAQVEWNEEKPKETLKAMGLEETPENLAAVRAMTEAIRTQEWPSSPFNTLSERTFEKAKYTIAGELLITNAVDIYGAEKGEKIRKIANGSLQDAALEEEFLTDVDELLKNKQTTAGETLVTMDMEIRSGLYEKCFNLVVSRNFRLNYQKAQETTATITVARRERTEGLQVQQGFEYKTVEVSTGLPSFGSETSTRKLDEGGTGYETKAANEDDDAGSDGAKTDHP